MSPTVLILDSDRVAREVLAQWLRAAGFECLSTSPDCAAPDALAVRPDAALVGANVGRADALRLAETLAAQPDPLPVIVLAQPDLTFALEIVRVGAFDCLPWPLSAHGLVDGVRRAVDFFASPQRHAHWQAQNDDHARQTHLLYAMRTVRALARCGTLRGYARQAATERVRCS